MPVRIYDIAKKYGLENKQIIEKAKSLGISAARMPSSPLDKISAGWLEEELLKDHPDIAAKFAAPKAEEKPKPAPADDEIKMISAPPPLRPQITITATGAELFRLVENILNDEIRLNLVISETEGSEPLRLYLARSPGPKPIELKQKIDSVPRVEIDEGTKKLLHAAYLDAARHSSEEWINLAEYGNAVKKLEPTFQPGKFGERSLGSLLRRVTDLFELRNDESNPIVYYLRMRPGQPAGPKVSLPQAMTANPPRLPKLVKGKVHNLRLGFGFIMPDDGSENAFFHATDVEGCTIFDLKPGDQVEYEPGFNDRGPCARKIHRVGNGSVL